jgi:hypothetical protein
MLSWWHRDVIAAGKLPLMLCFLSLGVTFVSTRATWSCTGGEPHNERRRCG